MHVWHVEVHGALLYVIYDSYDKGEKKTISIVFFFLWDYFYCYPINVLGVTFLKLHLNEIVRSSYIYSLFLLLSNKETSGYISETMLSKIVRVAYVYSLFRLSVHKSCPFNACWQLNNFFISWFFFPLLI